ncbi:MAG: hypothetical protein IPO92_19355 [Saprospiraceae bacterium]|nr:hypothetical protein [Saprospiraceae bacterium]
MDHNCQKIFGVSYDRYWELDLDNPTETYLYYDITESCNQFKIYADSMHQFWDGGDRIFVKASQSAEENRIGVFSRSQKTITWSYAIDELKDVWPCISNIAYAADRLYVLGRNGTLYMIEDDMPLT